jgi:hypothetical protein
MNNFVFCLAAYGPNLIAGGNFTMIGSNTVGHIAAWDGSSWAALGSGMDRVVNALTIYDDKLVAGGAFDSAGVVATNYIAAWELK